MDAYAELQARARDAPVADVRVDFGRVGMTRLGEHTSVWFEKWRGGGICAV